MLHKPLEWKLVIMLFKDLFGSGIKDIDPKRVVEWMYDTGDWPWYEKGIPYLYQSLGPIRDLHSKVGPSR
jgi:hypothetical protein